MLLKLFWNVNDLDIPYVYHKWINMLYLLFINAKLIIIIIIALKNKNNKTIGLHIKIICR